MNTNFSGIADSVMHENITMDSKTKSFDELNDVSYVGIAATLAIKVEPASSLFDNLTDYFTCSNYEPPLKREAVEPVSYHYNSIGETDKDGIASTMKQNSTENVSYSVRSCDWHEFKNVSSVDIMANVSDKIELEALYLDNATCQLGWQASTKSENDGELFREVVFKQETNEGKAFQNDIKNEISDRDFLETTSIFEDYDGDLRNQSVHNPKSKAGTRKYHEKCEKSDMNLKNGVLNEIEDLKRDCNLFVNSMNQGVCINVKTINIRNCSVLLERLNISSLKTIHVSNLQEQEKSYLDSHFNLNDQITSFQGSVSNRKCNNKSSYRRHKAFGGNSLQCSQLKKKCRKQNHIEKHDSILSDRNKCRLKSKREQHNLIHSSKMPYECSGCEKKFRMKSNLKFHKMIHSGKKPYECSVCEKKFSTSIYLKRHKLIHSGKTPYECSQCEKKFKTSSCLRNHELIHSDNKPYECSECEKKFTKKGRLEQHKLIHSGEKPYECSECEKKFRRNDVLKQHKVIHSEMKPYECSDCEKKFKLKCSLDRHKLIHSGIKPYECTECEKKFSSSRYLKDHKLTHSDNKPYECSECDKKFIQRRSLEHHKLIHSGIKPYECPECEKKFRSRSYLKHHKLIHLGKKLYECSECEKKFSTSSYLKQHKLIHSGRMPSELN